MIIIGITTIAVRLLLTTSGIDMIDTVIGITGIAVMTTADTIGTAIRIRVAAATSTSIKLNKTH